MKSKDRERGRRDADDFVTEWLDQYRDS